MATFHPAARALRRVAIVASLVAAATARGDDVPIKKGLEEKVRVQLVQLTFIAVDRGGKPVSGLTADDVEVTEGSSRRKLAFVQPYYGPRPAELPRPAPAEAGGSSRGPDRPRRWIVLVIDNYASSPATKLRAIRAAREWLDHGLAADDRVALVAFTGKTELVQSFTGDRTKLEAAIERVSGTIDRVAPDRFAAVETLMDGMQSCRNGTGSSYACVQSRAKAYEDDRERETDAYLVALTQLTRSLAPISDVKDVVFISEGFARMPASDAIDAARAVLGFKAAMQLDASGSDRTERAFDALADAAARARVSFFTINPGGAARAGATSAHRGSPLSESSNAEQIDVFRRSTENDRQGLAEMARRTGGTASVDPNVTEALRAALDLSAGLYTAGYYLADDQELFRARDVKIRVLRKGVRVEVRRELPRLPEAPLLTGELTLTPDPCSDRGRRIAVARLRIDRSRLQFERVDKSFSSNFSVYLRVHADDRAEPIYDVYRFLNITNSAEELAQGHLPDPAVEETLLVPCRPLTVVVTAVDTASGSQGDFTAHLGP